jgi:hypothetical protein
MEESAVGLREGPTDFGGDELNLGISERWPEDMQVGLGSHVWNVPDQPRTGIGDARAK